MGTDWRRQTMDNRVGGWAAVPAHHVPLGDVDCKKVQVPGLNTPGHLFTQPQASSLHFVSGGTGSALVPPNVDLFTVVKKAPTQAKKREKRKLQLNSLLGQGPRPTKTLKKLSGDQD